jgi:hypothetical protein
MRPVAVVTAIAHPPCHGIVLVHKGTGDLGVAADALVLDEPNLRVL